MALLSASVDDYGFGSFVKEVFVFGMFNVFDGCVNFIVCVGNTVILGGIFS